MQGYSTAVLSSDLESTFRELVKVGEEVVQARWLAASEKHELELTEAKARNCALANGAKTVSAADSMVVLDPEVIVCRKNVIDAVRALDMAEAREKATYTLARLRERRTLNQE